MNIVRDKFLYTAMELCWHVWTPGTDPNTWVCRCGLTAGKIHYSDPLVKNTDFGEWAGFGMLWEWAEQQDWWEAFWEHIKAVKNERKRWYINPDRLADAICEFLKNRER